METYIDKDYAVTANTLCSYFGSEKELKIPSRIALIDVKSIGHGAFYGNEKINLVIIPKEIETVGENAFGDCTSLKKVVFDGVPSYVAPKAFWYASLNTIEFRNFFVSKTEYENLKNISVVLSDGMSVIPHFPKALIPEGMFDSSLFATNIPNDISELFHCDYGSGKYYELSRELYNELTRELPNEHRCFMNHIHNLKPEYISPVSEKLNDDFIKLGGKCYLSRVVVFSFDDRITRQTNDGFIIHLISTLEYYFWQSAKKVICEGKEYFIYRRHYLTRNREHYFFSNPRMGEYIRKDVAVYTKNGRVNNEEEAKKVYAKYRLLSFI